MFAKQIFSVIGEMVRLPHPPKVKKVSPIIQCSMVWAYVGFLTAVCKKCRKYFSD